MPTLAGRSGIGERGAVKASRAHLRREPREDLRRPAALEMGHRIYVMECRKAPASGSLQDISRFRGKPLLGKALHVVPGMT
jgi:hypothetical protein